MKILVTGGAGFIGSAFIRYVLAETADQVVNVDKLSYAGNLDSLASVCDNPRYAFEKVDICDRAELDRVFAEHKPDRLIHLAAESHVDRSIDSPDDFILTNLLGTYRLLEAARSYWQQLKPADRELFRFHHVSTDEVFGDLEHPEKLFTEETPYAPSSPYSASKAGSDHLVRAWQRTYGLPVLISNCSNNYGPFQFPEKLIPLMIMSALAGKPLPVYGEGRQVRDWLFVEDHARALYLILNQGRVGQTYNVGGHNEKENIEVVRMICRLLEAIKPARAQGLPDYESLISFVSDRPGHDRRYAIDASKIARELGWRPLESFSSGLKKTVAWYLDNQNWCQRVADGSYRRQGLGGAKR